MSGELGVDAVEGLDRRDGPETSAARIVLVDDDRQLLWALAELLRLRLDAAIIDTCESAEAVLSRMASAEYDVLVSDVRMPRIDGLELLERTRVLQPHCLTIMITGSHGRGLAMHALRAGAYDFLEKPVDSDHFVTTVQRAVETSRLRREVDQQHEALRRHADELERAVDQRTRELERANQAKDTFIAAVSHELRTPLTAILGWARLLRSGALSDAKRQRAIEVVERNALAQAQLIEDLLDISRITTGKLRLEMEDVEAKAVVEAAVDAVLPAAQSKQIRIERLFEPGAGALTGDPERLLQICSNLLSNAVKFTPNEGRVDVLVRAAGPEVEITVTDTGVGMRAELLPFVFDRYRQGDSTLPETRHGLGLGLAIVRHLVELHGGTVTADSEGAGLGSTFRVRLPARLALPERISRTRFRTSNQDIYASPSECLRGIHVLVVEDEEDTRDALALALERDAARVTTARSSAEAFEAILSDPPDVLLCDIGLPEDDGYSLLAKVRALPPNRGGRVPAVALTAAARHEDCARSLAAGFQLHLTKPGPADLPGILASLSRSNRV